MKSTNSLLKNIEVPGIFNGSHKKKKKQLGPATSNADIFRQE